MTRRGAGAQGRRSLQGVPAAQTPKTIPVIFHNGGSYDFHFLLRYIATMGSPVCRAPRKELGEDSDNDGAESKAEGDQEGSKSERPMPMAKAAPKPKAAPKAKPRQGPSAAGAPCRPRSSRATTAQQIRGRDAHDGPVGLGALERPPSEHRHQRRPSAQASAARGAQGHGWPF